MATDDLGQELPEVDSGGPALVFEVVANHIAAQIARGDRAIGSRLPSELDLANMFGVARMTIRRAIRELMERGLVRAAPPSSCRSGR
jgi:DNA-binding GntR family transcriptional regulator